MANKNILGLTILSAAIALTGACQPAANTNTANTAANKTPANTSAANVSGNANTTTAPPTAGTKGSYASPSDAYHTAYDARKQCDKPTLKRVISKDMIDFLTEIGQADEKDKKSLDDMLQDLCDRPQAPNGDIRNEKITGDIATLEYQDETGKWRMMDFVKENGDWKLTMPKKGEHPVSMPKDSK